MRFSLLLEYDGTAYSGWQIQQGHNTIQGEIEQAISVVTGETTTVTGAGRTDAGVHAKGQVAHFDLIKDIDLDKLQRSLNGVLNKDIRVIGIKETDPNFHARYDAILREYCYLIASQPTALMRNHTWYVNFHLDLDKMNRASRIIHGRHDFRSFCRAKSEVNNHFCTVKKAFWSEANGIIQFLIQADRFLHGMVRSLVGTMMAIGASKQNVDSMQEILNKKNRSEAGQAAPAKGLILEKIYY